MYTILMTARTKRKKFGSLETSKSGFTESISVNTHRKNNSISSYRLINQRRLSSIPSTPNGNGTKNLRKLFETSNLQKSETKLERKGRDANLKLMELLNKCKIKYGVEFDVEFSKNFVLTKRQDFNLIVKGIRDELLILQSVLKKLKKYTHQMCESC
ncbi:hypothetical protein RF11_10985 [Thelohanellus kitauei]|uniref:Uncharacterized protein n=1 Tax=Thelohanellus kitauei TaxID=669202 RepID=A0A0C2IW22_THEKT|nr:hypothetical protein RF11_10985 [Thelohanellus kitauei]